MNFSTIHLPSESVATSNIPDTAVEDCSAPILAEVRILLITSLLISARISADRILANSPSASKPWTALRSCASSIVYSAFSALDLAVTVAFSIVKAISPKFPSPVSPTPNLSAAAVDKPEPKPETKSALSVIVPSVSASVTPARPVGSAS